MQKAETETDNHNSSDACVHRDYIVMVVFIVKIGTVSEGYAESV